MFLLEKVEQLLNKVNTPIANMGRFIGGVLLAIMTIIVLVQVFCRYVFQSPLSWTDELSCYLMIYMTYLCMPLIYLEDRNIAMTFLTEKIQGARTSHLLLLLVHIAAFVLFVVWIYFGWLFFLKGNVLANSLPLKMYYIYIIPPLLFGITCLSIFQKMISELNKFIHYRPQI